jgi:hypothetical protein
MSTVQKFELTLGYKIPYETSSTEEKTMKVYLTDPDGATRSRYMRMCMGTTNEELLATVRLFRDALTDENLAHNDKQALPTFLKLLGPKPRTTYAKLIKGGRVDEDVHEGTGRNRTTTRKPFGGDFTKATKELIKLTVEDPSAYQNIMRAFGDNKTFVKPPDVEVREHHDRITELCQFADLLPGSTAPLTDEEIKNIFFNSFPMTWKEEYLDIGPDIETKSIMQVKQWMERKKRRADKDRSSNKKRKSQDVEKGDKKGNKSNKRFKRSNKGTSINECKIHGGHQWKDCILNPRSHKFSQAALDKHRQRKGQDGNQRNNNYQRGFQKGGDRGQNRSRDHYTNDNNSQHSHEKPHNGPPSTTQSSEHQHSYANAGVPPPYGYPYGGYPYPPRW